MPPPLPSHVVVFTSRRRDSDPEGYAAMAAELERRLAAQPGFLGMDSVRDADGRGITVSWWQSRDAIAAWRDDPVHREAQSAGRAQWYDAYDLTIARAEEVRYWLRDEIAEDHALSPPRPPALDPGSVALETGSSYPEPLRAAVAGRQRRRLGNALGLTDFGVNLVTLAPGAASAQRHWHSAEDEFIHVLDGELTLITDNGEQVLGPGMCAGFPKGVADGHHLVNRGPGPARYLEIGSRRNGDLVTYTDVDLALSAERVFTHKDGRPW